MAFLGGTFDASTVEPSAPMELLQPGEYPVQIIESVIKDTSTGGKMLALTFEVIDGHSKGRRLWDNLNYINSNPQAQDIAHRAISAICHAVNVIKMDDTEQLHFKPLIAAVKVQPARTDPHTGKAYDASNRISGYKAYSGHAPASNRPAFGTQKPTGGFAASGGGATASAPAGGAAPPPWKR